jgi:hypothetical protein
LFGFHIRHFYAERMQILGLMHKRMVDKSQLHQRWYAISTPNLGGQDSVRHTANHHASLFLLALVFGTAGNQHGAYSCNGLIRHVPEFFSSHPSPYRPSKYCGK